MANPFDDPDGRFLVLANDLGRLSLWPAFAGIPPGWTPVFGEDSREACLSHLDP
ncbi:hypothetical protein GCM10022222_79860 [Amycolatopsis ultiminotia]|uniref:MbtH-like domain-containing protein n=1 Tax=Amycolatopsis ultiminotia TaxID=543629 RepID=A0ABP6YI70_9PSEU